MPKSRLLSKPSFRLASVASVLVLAVVAGYFITTSRAATLVGDLNNDNAVNVFDLSILLSRWGQTGTNTADLNFNGTVDVFDLSVLLSHWGQTATPTPTSSATPTPTPTPTPSASPTPTPTPSVGTWPSGWDDPRFANNVTSGPQFNAGSSPVVWQNLTVVDESGTESFGYQNYSLLNTRIRSREGPRVSGSNILIDGCYIEVHGTGTDHADGIQAYEAGNATNVVIRNTNITLTTGALNAGIFFADHSGASLTLENVYVDGSSAPNGAIWLPAASGDLGVKNLIARHVRVKNSTGRQGLSLAPDPSLVNIIEWTDVAWDDGTPIPRP